jgi:hypothetical protein
MTELLPRLGDDVVLAAGGHGRVSAHVVGVGDRLVRLVLRERLDLLPRELLRTPLLIEFVNDEGLSRLHGEADGPLRPVAGTGHGQITFTYRGRPQLLQRRAARASVKLALVVLRDDDPDAVAARATAVHLSTEGLIARGLPRASAGTPFRFELQLPGEVAAVTGRFLVEHVDADEQATVRFTTVDEPGAGLLRRAAYAGKAI